MFDVEHTFLFKLVTIGINSVKFWLNSTPTAGEKLGEAIVPICTAVAGAAKVWVWDEANTL